MDGMGKIIFYEDKNLQGRHYECSIDCAELNAHFVRCNSVRVESGSWVMYERPSYMGSQYVLTRGEYPDYQRWMGCNDSIRSCRIIQNTSGVSRMRVYERPDFSGQVLDTAEDVANLPERSRFREVHSAHVLEGAWVFYEHPNYLGPQYLLEKGEYRRFAEWGATNPTVGSVRHVQDL